MSLRRREGNPDMVWAIYELVISLINAAGEVILFLIWKGIRSRMRAKYDVWVKDDCVRDFDDVLDIKV